MTYKPYSSIKTTGFEYKYTNGSGMALEKGTPVKILVSGEVTHINVSIEEDVFALGGVVSATTSNGLKTPIVTDGRVEDVPTVFAFGDAVYIDKAGGLTSTKPEVGVIGFLAGDWIVRIGTIGRNEINPLLQDLILELNVIGQL
jgi:hypothetical protein